MRLGGDTSTCRSCGRTSWWARERSGIICRACGARMPASRMWMLLVSAAIVGLGGALWAID